MIPSSGAESTGAGSHDAAQPGTSAGGSPGGADPGTGSLPLAGLLQQILAATNDENELRSAAGPFINELTEVARELQGEVFGLEPVLIRLVRVFSGRIKGLSAEHHGKMERSVAGSLYDDIASRERVEKLWEALTRLAAHEK